MCAPSKEGLPKLLIVGRCGSVRESGLAVVAQATISQAARRAGRNRCDLCNRKGTIKNPLTRHHCDGNPRNNQPTNFMVVHRILCHTFADFVTQWHMYHDKTATFAAIARAWRSFQFKTE